MTTDASPISLNEAVKQFTPLVRAIAYKTLRRVPPGVQIDDLVQAGLIGLMEAARNYSAVNGASFKTFAGLRIHGAIIDELRRFGPLRRPQQREAKKLAAAAAQLERTTGRKPRDSEMAAEIGVPLSEYRRLAFRAVFGTTVNLDDAQSDPGYADQFADESCDPAATVERDEIASWLVVQMVLLSKRQRHLMRLYYGDGLTLAEIAQQIGVSQSRVSQILKEVVTRLRASLFMTAAA